MESKIEFWASLLHRAEAAANVWLVPGQGLSKGTHKVLLARASPFLRSLLLSVSQESQVTILLPDFQESHVEDCFQELLGGLQGGDVINDGGLGGGLGWTLGFNQFIKVEKQSDNLEIENVKIKLSDCKPIAAPAKTNVKCHQCDYEAKEKSMLKHHKASCLPTRKAKILEREQMQKIFIKAVESIFRGEESITSAARHFGLKRTTLGEHIRTAREGKQKTWKNRGRTSRVFTKEEENVIVDLVLKSDPKLTYRKLLGIMQSTLKSALANDPLRITGFERKNQKLTTDFVYRFSDRYLLKEHIKVLGPLDLR